MDLPWAGGESVDQHADSTVPMEIPPMETRVKLVAGMAVPYAFFAFLLGNLVGFKAALGLIAITAPIALLYLLAPGLFFGGRKAKGKGKGKAKLPEGPVEGSSHH